MKYCIGKNNHIGVHCTHCGQVVELPITEERLLSWDGRTHIQDHFPELTPGQREMFLSGICPKCWDEIFPPEEE